jgi:hypothetical protein
LESLPAPDLSSLIVSLPQDRSRGKGIREIVTGDFRWPAAAAREER